MATSHGLWFACKMMVQMQPKDESKRMATYMPLVGVEWNASEKQWIPVMYEPIILFKGKGAVAAKEKGLYAKGVLVLFQDNAVTDTKVMQSIAGKWFCAGSSKNRLLIMDSARQHFTEATVAEFQKHTLVLGRVPEGCTAHIQFLDLFWFFVFKSSYRHFYSEFRRQHPGFLSAAQKRVAMTILIAKANATIFDIVKPKLVSHFQTLGYLYDAPAAAIRPRPLTKFGYRFEAVHDVTTKTREEILSEVKESVPAPKPPPKGLAQQKMTSFFIRK
mmetsp:Transcript_128035/g.221226  ORF Transcript_128035/g.221226 Transcript_128035/m.221226 type:complete len:274 (-) Transcript_128035:140-961(-)